jgi:hypothetical protein
MADLLASLVVAAEKTTAEEGKDVITVMLIVGLVFLAVIAVGQLGRWLSHRGERHG